jgi:shikimate dehydrogenase
MMSFGSKMLYLGLVGWPLEHSFSPRLHVAALTALDLSGGYRLYPVPPLPEGIGALKEQLDQVRRGDLLGLNVTIPHKQAVAALMDDLTPTALAIGAVNTVFCREGRLIGDNTDAPGFLADLQRHIDFALLPEQPRALVLGAGGAARAVVYALTQAGWHVTLAARHVEQAQRLALTLAKGRGEIVPAALEADVLSRPVGLVVNATPLGMFPHTQATPWLAGVSFPHEALVYDLVYNSPETALVRAARSARLQAAGGMGMLIEQAALSLEIWIGRAVPRAAMWKSVEKILEKL